MVSASLPARSRPGTSTGTKANYYVPWRVITNMEPEQFAAVDWWIEGESPNGWWWRADGSNLCRLVVSLSDFINDMRTHRFADAGGTGSDGWRNEQEISANFTVDFGAAVNFRRTKERQCSINAMALWWLLVYLNLEQNRRFFDHTVNKHSVWENQERRKSAAMAGLRMN